jgi:methylated-DNA-protein-cysteine methyltransferase-like protein
VTLIEENFIFQVLAIVSEIPMRKIASYKQIAIMAGREKNARLVDKILSHASLYGHYPCHRVVNHAGKLVPYCNEQKSFLLQEDVTFKKTDMLI